MPNSKRKRGRPAKPLPEPIPDTPDNIAAAVLNSSPKRRKDWNYLKETKNPCEAGSQEE